MDVGLTMTEYKDGLKMMVEGGRGRQVFRTGELSDGDIAIIVASEVPVEATKFNHEYDESLPDNDG